MKIKFKKLLHNAVTPLQGHRGDAGYDLTAAEVTIDDNGIITYNSGIAVEIPHGYVGLLFPRSSIYKKGLKLTNCVGVIDSPYRGPVMAKFDTNISYWDSVYTPSEPLHQTLLETGILPVYLEKDDVEKGIQIELEIYKIGDRFIQLVIVPIPDVEYEEVEELSDSSRGEGGYGSTGV